MSKTLQLAQKVIDIRKRSGFTQEEIAKKLGVSRQSWILVEKADATSTPKSSRGYLKFSVLT